MKNLSLILNGVLALAVAVLYYLHFSSKGTADVSSDSAPVQQGDLTIAYVNSDSLLNNYSMFEDMRKELDEKRAKAEDQLMKRGRLLQGEVESFRRRASAGMVSNNEMKQKEQELMQKEQEIMEFRQTVAAGLMEEEKLINNKIYDSLVEYLKEYNKDKKYSYIFNYTKGGAIFLPKEGAEVTNEVLKGLNEKYKASKTTSDAKKDDQEKKDKK